MGKKIHGISFYGVEYCATQDEAVDEEVYVGYNG